MVYLIVILVLLAVSVIGYIGYKFYKRNKNKDKVKKPKEKPIRKVKVSKKPDTLNVKGSFVDTVDKFLYRKELKVLILVSRVLPKGYVAFPKIGLDTILEPVGRKDLFLSVANSYVDIVIFEETTMKPKVVVDIFDGSIGDEQLDVASGNVVQALKMANLPIVSIKVKTDYTDDEIKEPIMKALNLNNESSKEIK